MANNENNIEEAIVNHYHTLNYILTKLEDLSDKTKLSKSFDLLKYAIADAFEPVDEWFKDLEFAELYRLYEFSVSESGFKKTQKQADIINLKQITNNDIQLSKSILLLNAKYSSRKFENSLEEAKKQLNLKTKLKTKPETIADLMPAPHSFAPSSATLAYHQWN